LKAWCIWTNNLPIQPSHSMSRGICTWLTLVYSISVQKSDLRSVHCVTSVCSIDVKSSWKIIFEIIHRHRHRSWNLNQIRNYSFLIWNFEKLFISFKPFR
jgi:hypothetical protein